MISKSNLYISVGNTRTSFCVFGSSIKEFKIIKKNTKEILKNFNLEPILLELNINISIIFICSVVPSINKKIKSYFIDKEIVFLTSVNQKEINFNNITNPKEVGSDIVASAIYAKQFGDNITVASLGTATVIYNIDKSVFTECFISPGLDISYKALIEHTNLKYEDIYLAHSNNKNGTNTKNSLAIGVITGHELMIQELSKKFDSKDSIFIYFGGNSEFIKLDGWIKIDNMELFGLYLFSKSFN